MKLPNSLISGFAGSVVLTILHQVLRKTMKDAPKMDLLGEQAIQKIIAATGREVPSKESLFGVTMAGDLAANAGYYALVGATPFNPVVTGATLGLVAGVGAVVLPDPMGLNAEYSNETGRTQLLTIGLYLTGGIIAGLLQKKLAKNQPVYTKAEEAVYVH